MVKMKLIASAATLSFVWAAASVPAIAQSAGAMQSTSADGMAQPQERGDIIVTARKRAESDMAVPVVVTAISANTLANQGAVDIYKISQLVPQLVVSQGPSVAGGAIALRGISSGITNSSDQTVAINIDGVAVSNAIALRIGQFDLDRVEVLKGPQALFFGKNSPAGVLSFNSKGPTAELDGYVRTFYEFTADEIRTEGAIGGPLTDTIGVRAAGYYGHMEGYFRNPLPSNYAPGVVFGPHSRRVPNREEWGGRITLAFKPSDAISADLKFAVANLESTSAMNELQRISCPNGVQTGVEFLPGQTFTDCKLDRTTNPLGTVSPTVAAIDPAFVGEDYDKNRQYLGSLNIDAELSQYLTLTSISGYYKSLYRGLNLNAGPVSNVVTQLPIDRRDLSQELRLASDFAGPLNFTIGAFYQDSKLFYAPNVYRGPGAPGAAIGLFNTNRYELKGKTKSAFLQLSYKITDQIELSGGARYTNERKRERVFAKFNGADRTALLTPNAIEVNDWSPEISLTYRPTDDLTFFGSYKQGFKSGGFTTGTAVITTTPSTNAFNPEYIEGEEIGIKARLFDRALRLNVAAYNYKISDLQVSSVNPLTGTITTQNAASAKIRGIEADFAFNPRALEGLTINGALAYNQARYKSFIATCYTGQTISQGCDQVFIGTRFTSQDLNGRPLSYAPDWSGNLNASYEFPISTGLKAAIGGGVRFNSVFYAAGDLSPESVSKSAQFLDFQARVMEADDRWEVALIGRNITDKLRPTVAFDVPFSGTTSGFATGTRADVQAFSNRPREVILQFTYRL